MTRTEIELEYTIINDKIQNAGKFEFQPIYTPYFWDLYLDGSCDRTIDEFAFFELNDDDMLQFGVELRGYAYVMLEVKTDGFVHCEALIENDYRNLIVKLENNQDDYY